MKKLLFAACALTIGNYANAQDGFKKLPTGVEYKIVKDVPGTKTAKDGDFVMVHLQRKSGGQLQFDSRTMNNNEPVPYPIQPVSASWDPVELLKLVTAGDSIIIKLPADSMRKSGINIPEGDKFVDMYISVVDVKTAKERAEEEEKKGAAQKGIDDKLITDYLKKNNIKATKTASGLYYVITKPGTGEVIKPGQTAQVMYIGKLLNGNVFDKNMGEDAQHKEPLPVKVGQGMVIKGWDEGLMLLKKGEKATFFIPSPLAYGSQSPSPAIPANSVMVFDVEIKDVQD